MNTICFNAIRYTVEFLKLILVVVVLFRVRQRKKVYVSFVLSLLFIMFVSFWVNVSKYSYVYAIVAIAILTRNAYEKKKLGIISFSYIAISLVDMIFAVVCIICFDLDLYTIENNPMEIGLNLFSLVIIILGSVIVCKRKKTRIQEWLHIKKYLAIYILVGLALSLYLTFLQLVGMGEEFSSYQSLVVISVSFGSLVLIVLCALFIINSNKNDYLRHEADIHASLLETQKEYYMMLLEKESETKAFRHDIRKHISSMRNLYQQEKYEELGQYLLELHGEVEELTPKIQVGNALITAILNDILRKYPDVCVQWIGRMPEDMKISSVDLCTIFYNLLTNAVEAAQNTDEKEVEVTIKFMEAAMYVNVTNKTAYEPVMVNGEYLSSKQGAGHGYGISNVKRCVEKHNGYYSATYEEGYFVTEVIIPGSK